MTRTRRRVTVSRMMNEVVRRSTRGHVAALFLVVAAALMGCEEATDTQDTQRPTAERLVGRWQIEDYETGEADPDGVIVTFERGGTLVSTNSIGGTTISARGTWTLRGDILTTTVSALGITSMTEGRITELTGTRLCWRPTDADEDTCYRRRQA